MTDAHVKMFGNKPKEHDSPLKKGDQVAMLRVTTPSRAVSEAPLFVAEDVEEGGTLRRGVDTLAVMAVRGIMGLFDKD